MALGKSLGNILNNYFGEEEIESVSQSLSQNKIEKDKLTQTKAPTTSEEIKKIENLIQTIPLSNILVNPFQTRIYFNTEELNSLAHSIKENGLIQPIVVIRKLKTSTTSVENEINQKIESIREKAGIQKNKNQIIDPYQYTLIAGERRIRASRQLGWKTILAIIKDEDEVNEKQHALMSVTENIARNDLNPIELGRTFKMLIDLYKIDEAGVAELIFKSEQYVYYHLRLLNLNPEVQKIIMEPNKVGEGHARHLVGLDPEIQLKVAKAIVEKDLSIKEMIRLIQNLSNILDDTLPLRTIGHKLPPEYIKRANKLTETIPNAFMQCYGDEEKGRIVIKWGDK